MGYKEKIPDLELVSSETKLVNLVLHGEAQKAIKNFFIRAQVDIPLSSDEARENWTRHGEFEQTNSLTYRWTRADAHVGYFFKRLLNPYIGMHWSYAAQERSNFENVSTPGIFAETAKEEVYSFAALLGIQGVLPLAPRWSLTYRAEYMLPFYTNVTNSNLPGWEASNVNGYSFAAAGGLNYAFSASVSTTLEISGGRQHWEGSDWIQVGDFRAKWPENDTDFISCTASILMYF